MKLNRNDKFLLYTFSYIIFSYFGLYLHNIPILKNIIIVNL